MVISASIVTLIVHGIRHLPGGLVYGLVAVLVFGEAALFIGFVLPGETSVIIAGVVASQGRVNIAALCALVVVAAIVGDSVGYAIGHRFGEGLLELHALQKRRAALDRALAALRQRGPTYVFVGRFTAFLRAVMPGLAGVSRMRYRSFLAANALGALVWGIGFSLLGYFAGAALTTIENAASWFSVGVLVVVVGVVIVLYTTHRRRERSRSASDEPTDGSAQSGE